MRRVQVIPADGAALYAAMVAKEIELHKKNRGTFYRSGSKEKDRAKWSHRKYPGWIKLGRGMGGVVEMEIRSKVAGAEWQLLDSMLGFVDRHFGDKVAAINIQYDQSGG